MKSINTVIFDLDGTLLPMDTDAFIALYNKELAAYFADIMAPEVVIKAIWEATKKTIMNREPIKNLEVFKEALKEHVEDVDLFYRKIYDFYDEVFVNISGVFSQSEEIVEAIKVLKAKGYRLMIATNPLFPMKANHTRIKWAGLSPTDFEYISCFEENHYCKPHLEFYQEVLSVNELNSKETLMVGNDVTEDLVAGKLGIKTYLIEDHIIHRNNEPILADYRGRYSNFLEFVNALEDL